MKRITFKDGNGKWCMLLDGKEHRGKVVHTIAGYEDVLDCLHGLSLNTIVAKRPDLRPCPFCGGRAEIVRRETGKQYYLARCASLDCYGGWNCMPHKTPDEAAEAWNRRCVRLD